MRLKMCSLLVDDPIKAHEFYTGTLGFHSHMYMPEHQLAIVTAPSEPDGTTILLEPESIDWVKSFRKNIRDMKLPVIIFGVPDVKAEYERLSALGIEFIKEPTTNDWGTEAVFDDTCGNYIQIHQD